MLTISIQDYLGGVPTIMILIGYSTSEALLFAFSDVKSLEALPKVKAAIVGSEYKRIVNIDQSKLEALQAQYKMLDTLMQSIRIQEEKNPGLCTEENAASLDKIIKTMINNIIKYIDTNTIGPSSS